MKILVACEESGTVRDAFSKRGHDAWSCDLLPSRKRGKHYLGDVRDILYDSWDMVIAHPVCKYLTNSGVCHLYIGRRKENGPYLPRWEQMKSGVGFFNLFLDLPHIKKVVVENPIMHKYARELIKLPYTQIIQPYMFGHMEQKATCLWLKGVEELQETNNVYTEMMKLPDNQRQRLHYLPPGPNRERDRSATFQGIAAAKWG